MNTTLHVTIDKEIKKEAAKLAAEMGLDLSTIVKSSLKTFVETKTFHVEKNYRMTPYLERVIETAMNDFEIGRNISGPFSTPEESINHLRKVISKK